MRGVKVTDEKQRQIIAAARGGEPVRLISEWAEVSERGIIRILRTAGFLNPIELASRALRERVIAATRAGESARVIADRERVTQRTVCRIRTRAGIERPTVRHTDADYARAKELLDDGAGYAETSRTVGIREETLARQFPGKGWTPAERLNYRHCMAALEAL